MSKVLITGGAGFIGSHTADYFIKRGLEVNVIDNLSENVHINKKKPNYLNKKVKYFFGDMRDSDLLKKALNGVSYVVNDYSLVGTGISMHDFNNFLNNNIIGTSNLWHVIISNKLKIKRFIQASSVSVYGEGKYKCNNHGIFYPSSRLLYKKKGWDVFCEKCKKFAKVQATDEKSEKESNSIYSLTKQHQEEISMMLGKNYGIETIVCRYFNCYGSRLSFNNPYTGVTSIFINSILQNVRPIVYEDGNQIRDYIHVSDLVRAKYLLTTKKKLKNNVFNLGTGIPLKLIEILEIINKINKSAVKPKITNEFRKGDIRSCFANIKNLENLNFVCKKNIYDGLEEMIKNSEISKINNKKTYSFMKSKGLIIS